MKQFTFLLCLIPCLFSPKINAANVITRNAVGIIITFLDDSNTSIAQEVVLNAMSLKGIKYKYGGSSPETGFDCSGFVNYVYSKAANIKLPRTSRGISRLGSAVSRGALKAGDLIFFNTAKREFSHVGIYVGDGKFIHSPRTGSFVRVESMQTSYWTNRFNGAKRLDKVASN